MQSKEKRIITIMNKCEIAICSKDAPSHSWPANKRALNATFGNAAKLIITLAAILAGQMQLVLATITGSILGNFS